MGVTQQSLFFWNPELNTGIDYQQKVGRSLETRLTNRKRENHV